MTSFYYEGEVTIDQDWDYGPAISLDDKNVELSSELFDKFLVGDPHEMKLGKLRIIVERV